MEILLRCRWLVTAEQPSSVHLMPGGHLDRPEHGGLAVPTHGAADQVQDRLGRAVKAARPPDFVAVAYKQRNTVERAFSHLRQHRAVATRYDKRDYIWRGTIDVASIWIWLRHPVPP